MADTMTPWKPKKLPASSKMAKVNRQDTRHGKMDMPNANLNKFVGMKGGGMAKKVKRFDGTEGSEVEYEDYVPGKYTQSATQSDKEIYRRPTISGEAEQSSPSRASAPAARSVAAAPVRTPAPASSSGVTPAQEAYLQKREREKEQSDQNDRELARTPKAKPASGFGETRGRREFRPDYEHAGNTGYKADEVGAVTGRRGDPKYKRVVTDAQKEKNAQNFGEVATALVPGGAAIKGAHLAYKGLSAVEKLAKLKKADAPMREILAARRAAGYKKGGEISRFAKGGGVMESKAMEKKEINFFKKKGAPASMIKHEEKEAKGMGKPMKFNGEEGSEVKTPRNETKNGAVTGRTYDPKYKNKLTMAGGEQGAMRESMIRSQQKADGVNFAKGGGIESRGKTKGSVVRMAAGGAVKHFAKGGGIESRGKTKGRFV